MQRVLPPFGISGVFTDANRLVSVAGSGLIKESLILDGVTAGVLTLAKTGTTARTKTFQDTAATIAELETAQSFSALQTLAAGLTVTGAAFTLTDQNAVLSATTGTKWGTATTQKQAWWNATPIVQPSGDVITALGNLGLISAPTISATTLTGIVPSANGGTGVSNAGTLTNASNTTITGGGAIALGGFTLTVPATLTVAGLGIANAFTAAQTIDNGTGAMPFALGTTGLQLMGADAVQNILAGYAFGNNGLVLGGTGIGGTRAAPTPTAANQVLVRFIGKGYDGTTYNLNGLLFDAQANGLWSASNRGSKLVISGVLNGVNSPPANWLWLQGTTGTDPVGTLGLGAAPTAGNGLVQRASGTTKAYGDAWGTDCFLYRSAAGQLTQLGTGGLLVQQAATQDAVLLLGRAGGTSSYAVTLTPAAMTASYTLTIPALAAADTIATLGLGNTFTAAQTIALGTITTSQPALSQTQTWNAAGVTFTGSLLNVTSTASAAGSMLEDWQLAGTSLMKLVKDGALVLGNSYTAGNGLLQLASGTTIANGVAFGTDTFMFRSAAGAVQFRASGTGATMDMYDVNATGCRVQVVANNSGGGFLQVVTAHPLTIKTNNTNAIVIDSAQKVTISAATASTSTSTGSLVNTGGQGNAGALFNGGVISGADDLKLTTAGKGIYVKEGSNATMGKSTMVGGTVTVSNTKVTASSRIFLTVEAVGGTLGIVAVTARVAGTSFTITSSNALDTSDVAWLIVEPA